MRAARALLTEVEDTVEPMPPPAEPAETTPSDFDPRPVRAETFQRTMGGSTTLPLTVPAPSGGVWMIGGCPGITPSGGTWMGAAPAACLPASCRPAQAQAQPRPADPARRWPAAAAEADRA